jgi:hypothetical protein
VTTGDQSDQVGRLKALLPRWFGDTVPVLSALLAGYGYVQAFLFSLVTYAKLQTRVLTATGGWLDLISADFFGTGLPRIAGQSDASFRNRIIANLFRKRGTRADVIAVLESLTGRTPDVFEPRRVLDTGAYGAPLTGYGAAGGYGSILLPYQAFVTAYRPLGTGIPLISGYNIPAGGYGVPSRAAYGDISTITEPVNASDIFAAIDSVKPAGTIVWARIGMPVDPTINALNLNGGHIFFGGGRLLIEGWDL